METAMAFAARATLAALKEEQLPFPLKLRLSGSSDDCQKNSYVQHWQADGGMVAADIYVMATKPDHWVDATISLNSEFSLWQYYVRAVRPDGPLQLHRVHASA